MSVTVTPVAGAGPLLVTVSMYVIGVPSVALAGAVSESEVSAVEVWNAPTSQAAGRVTPRSSVAGHASGVLTPSPIAGLPASSSSVCVVPPLLASVLRSGFVLTWSWLTLPRKQVLSLSMLPPLSAAPALSVGVVP